MVECVDPRWLGIVAELGIETVYATPYRPWSKGTLERWFGTFESQCGKSFVTYCGRSTIKRPDCLEAIRRGYTREERYRLRKKFGNGWSTAVVLRMVDERSIPTLEQSRWEVASYLNLYHNAKHSAADLDGMTPMECWHTATSIRRAVDRQLMFLMQGRGVYRVGKNGVRVTVGNTTIGYCSPALQRLAGRDVFITIDPNNLNRCDAYTPERDNRKHIASLQTVEPLPANCTVDELREANANINKRRKVMGEAERSAGKRTRNASRELTAMRREQAAVLLATGTDDDHPAVSIVRTGFEGVSTPVRNVVEDHPQRDLEAISKALFQVTHIEESKEERSMPSLDLLTNWKSNEEPSMDSDDSEHGTDADSATNLLTIVSGHQHGRTEDSAASG